MSNKLKINLKNNNRYFVFSNKSKITKFDEIEIENRCTNYKSKHF